MAKKQLDDLTKTKLIYCVELLVFVVLALVLALLHITGVRSVVEWKRWLVTIGTLVGAVLIPGDWIWLLCSPKRRKKVSYFDKFLTLPVPFFMVPWDIYVLTTTAQQGSIMAVGEESFRYVLSIALFYLSAVYLAMAIYHWFKPAPALLIALEKAEAEERAELEAAAKAEEEEKAEPEPSEEPKEE